jgi:hypothetical protein
MRPDLKEDMDAVASTTGGTYIRASFDESIIPVVITLDADNNHKNLSFMSARAHSPRPRLVQ